MHWSLSCSYEVEDPNQTVVDEVRMDLMIAVEDCSADAEIQKMAISTGSIILSINTGLCIQRYFLILNIQKLCKTEL